MAKTLKNICEFFTSNAKIVSGNMHSVCPVWPGITFEWDFNVNEHLRQQKNSADKFSDGKKSTFSMQ